MTWPQTAISPCHVTLDCHVIMSCDPRLPCHHVSGQLVTCQSWHSGHVSHQLTMSPVQTDGSVAESCDSCDDHWWPVTWRLSGPSTTQIRHQDLELTLRKIAIWLSKNCQKLDIFSKKIAKNFHFFQKNCHFWQLKNFFFKILAIFWHSNGNFPEGQLKTFL